MPEIGEVAHTVHNLVTHLLHRTITQCTATPDDIVYGKVGTTAEAFQLAVQGRRVTGAAQQGKYFYMTFDRPPHAVMHLGMTGWIVFKGMGNRYYKQGLDGSGSEGEEGKGKGGEEQEWPPKYAKFILKSEKEDVEGEAKGEVEAAFIDPRRLARIRLVDCAEEDIRMHSPLKENGPDPVRDKDIVTVEWLTALLARKKVPVKALLLNQANISGIGNWVADEILYQARLHPEQYSNTFSTSQIQSLHDALTEVCGIAVGTLADSRKFPEDWLMKYRWGKGKKGGNTLPNGEKITFVTVGGRTSAVVATRQKKTGPVAGGEGAGEAVAKKGGRKRKAVAKDEDEDEDEDGSDEVAEEEVKPVAKKSRSTKKAKPEPLESDAVGEEAKLPARNPRRAKKAAVVEAEDSEDEVAEEEAKPATKKGRAAKNARPEPVEADTVAQEAKSPARNPRRAQKAAVVEEEEEEEEAKAPTKTPPRRAKKAAVVEADDSEDEGDAKPAAATPAKKASARGAKKTTGTTTTTTTAEKKKKKGGKAAAAAVPPEEKEPETTGGAESEGPLRFSDAVDVA